jgi:GDP-L-fucose synthase
MDSSRIAALGWKPEISLEEGVASTYKWYITHLAAAAAFVGCPAA